MLLKNKVEIEDWLKKHKIRNYELIEDAKYGYVVNINGNVLLWNWQLKSIDVKFNIVKGYFDCSKNNLTSLEGCPKIVGGAFNCSNNQLKFLIDFPINVRSTYLRDNNLSLDGLKNLINVETISNYIDLEGNKNLDELQEIKNFNELKIILEKEELNKKILCNNVNYNSIKIKRL